MYNYNPLVVTMNPGLVGIEALEKFTIFELINLLGNFGSL